MENKIIEFLEEDIKAQSPEAVLLSGGIDSSSLMYLGKKFNSNIKAITVLNSSQNSSDEVFAKKVAKKLEIKNHYFPSIEESEIESLVEKVAISLNTFSIYWVSAGLVLYKGLEFAKENNINSVATGEGSDDLFASFPVMLNWKRSNDELIDFIQIRMKDIDIMTNALGESLGVKIHLPFHNKNLVEFVLNLPIENRFKKDSSGKYITKFLLRDSFDNLLPEEVVTRPQTMAFEGVSTLSMLLQKYENYCNIEEYKIKFDIDFKTGFECYLFDLLQSKGLYKISESKNKTCLYCKSKLRDVNSVHCRFCGNLQYKGEILEF